MPADRRPPRRRNPRPGSIRHTIDPLGTRRRRLERIWARALRRFRDHLHGTDHDTDPPGSRDDRPQ